MSGVAATTEDLEASGFRAVRVLGQGATATAWEAEELATGRRVCVKRFDKPLGVKELDRARLEHDVLRALDGHPHVLPTLAMKQTPGGQTYMVTALLEGRTLQEELTERRRLPEADVIALGLQLMDGLGAAHTLGVVHRDIKPANLFLVSGPPRRLVIMDFGLAKVTEAEAAGGQPGATPGVTPLAAPTTAGLMLGTPRYMAPEQLLAKPVDGRADLYSAALVLYRAAAGRGAFDEAKSILDVAEAQLQSVPAPPSTHAPALSAGLDAILLRALAKRREDRYASAREMADALLSLERGAQARARAMSPPTESLPHAAGAHRWSADAPTATVDLGGLEPARPPSAARSQAMTRPEPGGSKLTSSLDDLTQPIEGLAQRTPGPSAPETYPHRAQAGESLAADDASSAGTSSSPPAKGRRLIIATAVVCGVALLVFAIALRVLG